MKITVFTPTYNRASTLGRLYDSLKIQSQRDFEWLIIDDGSTDDTEKKVNAYISNTDFSVRYIKKTNGGKHKAYNLALKEADGELFICVDSDDTLAEGAISAINEYCADLSDSCAGIIAYKSDLMGNNLGLPLEKEIYSTFYDLSVSGHGGERSIVFKTEIAKKYPFDEITGESFETEAVIYDRIDRNYNYLTVPVVLTVCEYRPDGYTANIYSMMMKNPTGYKIFHSQRIDIVKTCKERFLHIVKYCAFTILSHCKAYKYTGIHKTVVIFAFPIGAAAALYYKIKQRKS